MPALRSSILLAVKAAITALNLSGVKGVYIRKGKRSTAVQRFPCVEISRDDSADGSDRLTFGFDQATLPVRIVYLFNDPMGDSSDLDRVDDWSQAIARLFREPEVLRTAPGSPGVWNTEIRPLPELDPDDRRYSQVAGGLLLLVKTYEPRGSGA